MLHGWSDRGWCMSVETFLMNAVSTSHYITCPQPCTTVNSCLSQRGFPRWPGKHSGQEFLVFFNTVAQVWHSVVSLFWLWFWPFFSCQSLSHVKKKKKSNTTRSISCRDLFEPSSTHACGSAQHLAFEFKSNLGMPLAEGSWPKYEMLNWIGFGCGLTWSWNMALFCTRPVDWL